MTRKEFQLRWPVLAHQSDIIITDKQIRAVSVIECLFCLNLSHDWITLDFFIPTCTMDRCRPININHHKPCDKFQASGNMPPRIVHPDGTVSTMPAYKALLSLPVKLDPFYKKMLTKCVEGVIHEEKTKEENFNK